MSELYLWIRSLWMLWLLLLFIGIVAWVYWPSRRRQMERHGEIPFRDGDEG